MPVVRPREQDGCAGHGRQLLEEVCASGEGSDRVAVRHRLAHRREVWRDPADPLVAAQTVPETSDDLVEDQHDRFPVAGCPQPFEEARLRQHGTDVVSDRLDDDRCDFAAVLCKRRVQSAEIVEREDDGRLNDLGEDSGRERILPSNPIMCRDDVQRDGVVPSVEASLELDQETSSGNWPSQAYGVEGRLGASAEQHHALGARDMRADSLGEGDLMLGHADPDQIDLTCSGRERTIHIGICVPEDQGAVRSVIVDESSPVGYP